MISPKFTVLLCYFSNFFVVIWMVIWLDLSILGVGLQYIIAYFYFFLPAPAGWFDIPRAVARGCGPPRWGLERFLTPNTEKWKLDSEVVHACASKLYIIY